MKKIFLHIALFASLTSVAQVKIDRTKAPNPAEAPQINIGSPATFTLDNGLKVFVVENHNLPKVSFQLTVDKDPVLEKGKVGLSDMMGDMLGAGTSSKSKAEIDAEIDFIGATVSTFSSGFYASSLSKHSDKVLSIASDMLLNPAFPQEELDKKKKRAFSGLKSLSTNADAIAARVGNALLYGKNHPYGEVQLKSDIENITIEDCKGYYETYFRPNISYLVIVGDITVDKAKDLSKKYFGKWEKADVPSHTYDMPEPINGVRVAFVNKPGAVQSVVKVMYPLDYKIGAPDAPQTSVMANIFGGAFSSYLNANLREDKGFTYGARGSITPNKLVGSFKAGASVRNEVTDSSITEIFKEMNRIINEKVDPLDLERIKNNMIGGFALSLENPRTIARFALNVERYNLPKDYYQTYLSKVQKVNQSLVMDAAKKYIHPENCIVLVVGNKEIADKLTKFDSDGKIEFYDINADIEVEKEEIPIPEGVSAQSIIDDYVLAMTGQTILKKAQKILNKVKDRTVTMSMSMEMQGQSMTLDMISKQKAPNKMLMEIQMNGMTVQKQVFDGEKGGSSGMQGKTELTNEEIKSSKADAQMHKELMYADLGYKLTLESIEEVNGKQAYKIKFVDPSGKVEYQYYDVESKLLVYAMSTEEGPDGSEMTVTTEYSDYQEVKGIKYPFKRSRIMGPQTMEITVKSVEVNTKLEDDLFKWE